MFTKNSFFLLTAPPAWGKTRLFREWIEIYPKSFLYVSPLRALANEVMSSLQGHPGLMKLNGRRDKLTWKTWVEPQAHSRVLVVTPEELGDFDWQGLAAFAPDAVVIWDEIHLIPLWGFEFRERLLQQWWGYISSGICGVGLTATADNQFLDFFHNSLTGFSWDLISGDAGNFRFKNEPSKVIAAPQAWIELLTEEAIDNMRGNILVFCAHREEVDLQVRRWTSRGVLALGCKGGETVAFQTQLKEVPPDRDIVIFSTTCLSHGVNLPKLKKVVLLYPEKNSALFHQMITRGGRRGESFEVWHPWNDKTPWVQKICDTAKLSGRVLVVKVWQFMGEWWNGTRRLSHSSYSPKRA